MKKFTFEIIFLFLLFFCLDIYPETLLIMDIADNTAKIHPNVVEGSKEYLAQLLGRIGKYQIIPDAQLQDIKKRSQELSKCTSMECQTEIGKILKADIVVTPSVDYFAGIFTLTINYIYVDGNRKTEAAASDFNGTAIGIKKAIEACVSSIHGKKTEEPVFIEENEALEKYKAENFKVETPKDYVIPAETPVVQPAAPAIVLGSAEFLSSNKNVTVTLDVSGDSPRNCTAPCTITDIKPGTHTVRFESEGFSTKDETIEIISGRKSTKNITLVQIVKSLEEVNNDLIAAVKSGDLDLVKILLSKGADINYHDKSGLSPLLIAILNGNRQMTGYFIGRGAKLASVETTALMRISVDQDNQWIASVITKQKNMLNLTFENGQTILWIAANQGAWKVFDEYLKGGVSTGIKNSAGQTLPVWAIENNNSELLQRLIKANVRISPEEADSMLKQAVINEDFDKIKLLLMFKPDLNKVYEDGLTLLWYAALKERNDIVEILLNSGAKAETADKSGKTLLSHCVETRRYETAKLLKSKGAQLKSQDSIFLLQRALVIGDSELVQTLIELGININTKFSDGLSALWIAAFTNNRDMIEILAKGGANMNIKDSQGKTVLMWAVENDKKEVANVLIKYGANINLMDNRKRTALISAVIADKPRMVHMLVMNGAQIDLKDNDGNSAILIATSRGNTELVKLFLEHKSFINASDSLGNTPILISLYKNFDDITELLLNKGADLNKPNTAGETPLIVASKKGHIRFVKTLTEKGVNIDTTDKNGDSAIILAKRENKHDVVFWLLSKNAMVEKRSEQDELMAYATLNSYHDIAENLIQRQISPNRRFHDGLFPLWYATRNGDAKMISMLLAAGADLEAKNKEGETVLLYACAKREEHVILILLESGADFKITDNQKSTPLMIVASRGFEKAVRLLISKKADLNAKDDKGRTAIIRAQYTGNYNIVDMLRRAGAYD